jgi:hypothetical protein
VILKKELNVYMTGESLPSAFDLISEYNELLQNSADYKTQSFESVIPLPSYLIAIVVGNVV